MELETLKIKLLPKLTDTGSVELADGVYPLTQLVVGARDFVLADGISYDVGFTNTGEALLLTGTATANLKSPCDRCLEDAQTSLVGTVEGYYLLEQPEDEPDDDSAAEFEFIDDDGMIDLAPALVAAVVFELPAVVLCQPDCLGICPGCGANLNLEDCCCAPAEADLPQQELEIDPNSPFSALATLKDLL